MPLLNFTFHLLFKNMLVLKACIQWLRKFSLRFRYDKYYLICMWPRWFPSLLRVHFSSISVCYICKYILTGMMYTAVVLYMMYDIYQKFISSLWFLCQIVNTHSLHHLLLISYSWNDDDGNGDKNEEWLNIHMEMVLHVITNSPDEHLCNSYISTRYILYT